VHVTKLGLCYCLVELLRDANKVLTTLRNATENSNFVIYTRMLNACLFESLINVRSVMGAGIAQAV
jgi:hypothetical protein